MGITKTEGFSSEVKEVADLLKAIGHPARWAIMEFLAVQNSCICNDIVHHIPLAQPTISRHLSELKKVGLIQGTSEGKNLFYCINKEKWQFLLNVLYNINDNMHNINQCCY